MHNIEAINAIKKIENELRKENYLIKGEDTYLIFRNYIFSSFIGKKRDRQNAKSNSEIWRRAFNKLFYVFRKSKEYLTYKKKYATVKQKRHDILICSSIWYRRVKVGKYHYNPFTDPIMEYLDNQDVSNVIFEYSGNHDGFKKINSKKSYTDQLSIIIPQIKSLFTNNLSVKEKNEISQLVDNLNTLLNGYNIKIDRDVIIKRISLFFYLKNQFKKKIKAFSPKLILLTCYYDYSGFALIAAANELGIHTYDIQHGVQGKYHVAYGILDKNTSKNTLKPTGYIVQSNKDKNNLLEYQNIENENVIVTGHMFDEFLKHKIKGTNIGERLNSLKQKVSDKIILISLQYGIGIDKKLKYILTNTHNQDIRWWIRLHPNMKEFEKKKVFEYFSNNKINKVSIEEPSNLPLEILFSNIDLQITHYSSTAIDGLNYGVKTLLINPIAKDYFREELEENELLEYTESAEEIIKKLSEIDETQKLMNENTPYNIKNFKKNLLSLIDMV